MPEKPIESFNYLLGYGERLSQKISHQSGGGAKSHPYSFDQAKKRLIPKIDIVAKKITALPAEVCPNNQSVALITLHPTYLAKTQYPVALLQASHLTPIGSHIREIKPEKIGVIGKNGGLFDTTELFVSGDRNSFGNLNNLLTRWNDKSQEANDFRKIEDIRPLSDLDIIKPFHGKGSLLEIVLHASSNPDSDYILDGFRKYLSKLKLKADFDQYIFAGGLCFIPMSLPSPALKEVSKYSFLRVIRQMPKLRSLRPILRSVPTQTPFNCALPNDEPIDQSIRVAVFDGGIPPRSALSTWARSFDTPGLGASHPSLQEHGFSVTSALLFGPLRQNELLARPYSNVDHFRVLDSSSSTTDANLIDVLERIKHVLQTRQYEFVNLSIGPHMPIEDSDVTAWTAVLDQLFSTGNIFASIAVGNDGDLDRDSGNARIQVPSDCVNAIAVGACDKEIGRWSRASYSSIGPGRHPGVIKPDVITFGGVNSNPFSVLDLNNQSRSTYTTGTSFSSPNLLRTAIGIRSHLGSVMSSLGLKALLIHNCEQNDEDKKEIGWGRVPKELINLITSKSEEAHILYQGNLDPAQWLRIQIPLPHAPLVGKITIKATFCFTTETDPQDPLTYTKSGLEIIFRPNIGIRKKSSQLHPDTKSFFKFGGLYSTESELRKDAHKWETTLSTSRSFQSKTLHDPVFDVHYNARTSGGPAIAPRPIPYSLVLTVTAPKIPDLYNRLLRRYQTQLEALRPVVPIQIRG